MIQGIIDLFEEGKIFGWAFDQEAPAEYLTILVYQGENVVAEGSANKVRSDLAGAGIGEGDHAFEFSLPDRIKALRGLRVFARSSRNETMELKLVTAQDRRIEQAVDEFSEILNRKLSELEKRVSNIEQTPNDDLKRWKLRVEAFSMRLDEIETKLEESDVFLVRIDEKLSALLASGQKRKRKKFLGLI